MWLASIFFGDLTELSDEIIQSFRVTGLLHLLVVSGLHISFLAEIFRALCVGPLRLFYAMRLVSASAWPKMWKIACCMSLVGILIFSFLIGFPASAQRASLIFFFSTINLLFLQSKESSHRAVLIRAVSWQSFLFPLNFLSLSNILTWSVYVTLISFDRGQKGVFRLLALQLMLSLLVAGLVGDLSLPGILLNIWLLDVFLLVFLLALPLFVHHLIPDVLSKILIEIQLSFVELINNIGVFSSKHPWLFLTFGPSAAKWRLFMMLCVALWVLNNYSMLSIRRK